VDHGLRNGSGSLAILAAIRRASSDLIVIKFPIDPLCLKSREYVRANEPLGSGHEAFAVHLGSFGRRLHRKTRGSAKRCMVRLLQYGGWWLAELRVCNL
jgi:hypothetical protein